VPTQVIKNDAPAFGDLSGNDRKIIERSAQSMSGARILKAAA
jgi:hypothetical protein